MLAHALLIGTCREIACARVWVLFIDVVVRARAPTQHAQTHARTHARTCKHTRRHTHDTSREMSNLVSCDEMRSGVLGGGGTTACRSEQHDDVGCAHGTFGIMARVGD